MESQDVSEKVEWEARRVAAAFGLKESVAWEKVKRSDYYIGLTFNALRNDIGLGCEVVPGVLLICLITPEGKWSHLGLLRAERSQQECGVKNLLHQLREAPKSLQPSYGEWYLRADGFSYGNGGNHDDLHELLARGLYCLDFEGEGVLAKLNTPLSAHEKLELRLSLPREFWPQKWLDEEGM